MIDTPQAERDRAKARRYYAANRERINAKLRARYAAGLDRRRELQRAYYAENRERVMARARAYHVANRESIIVRQRGKDSARRAERSAYMRSYHQSRKHLGLVVDRVITEAQWAFIARAANKASKRRGKRNVHNDKMIQFVKRWRDLDARQADIDHARSTLCREIRDEFQDGERGDHQFVNWCALELGLPPGPAHEALSRAAAAKTVSDPLSWKKLGGFKQIRHVATLDKREQVNVLEAAKASGKAVSTIIRERSASPPPERVSPRADAEVLAAYVASLVGVPKHILAIAARYRRETVKKAA